MMPINMTLDEPAVPCTKRLRDERQCGLRTLQMSKQVGETIALSTASVECNEHISSIPDSYTTTTTTTNNNNNNSNNDNNDNNV